MPEKRVSLFFDKLMFCFLKSRPVYNRIPNFKGASRAAANLTEQLQEFRDARTIKVNPDKPQEEVRFKVVPI